MKKTWMIIPLLMIILHSCGPEGGTLDVDSFAQMYSQIQQTFRKQMNRAGAGKNPAELMRKKNSELEKLLARSRAVPYSEKREIIKSKILIHLKELEKAEKIINPLLGSEGDLIDQAKMVKIQILLARSKGKEALKLFREVENGVARDRDFFSVCLYFALKAADPKVREEFSNNILNAGDRPAVFDQFKARLYSSLAAAAYERNEMERTQSLMKKAISLAVNPLEEHILKSRLSQLEMIGKPAPPLDVDTWINSPALRLNRPRGKKMIIDFWATWCQPCREALPVLAELSNRYSQKDLMVVGITKLYGLYRDGKENRTNLGKAEEISLIEKFVEEKNIPYSVAISHQGEAHRRYFVTGIPVMVFINPSGDITHIQMGGTTPDQLRKKIIDFMERN